MYSFIISIFLLVLGYVFYGALVEKIFGPDPNKITPAVEKNDGVDFVPMPSWKVYMIQFLNIAGTGPIFGAIMGAQFGPASYLWIVFGCIFAGAVHDYFTGMYSIRNGGASIPDIVGKYMGKGARVAMLLLAIVLLLLVGAVFVYSPALILGGKAPILGGGTTSIMIWVGIIFLYYVIATLLPIDKIIGRFYPIFAFSLLFMAVALCVCLFIKWPSIPEVWNGLGSRAGAAASQPLFPCLFITIACGAISGFHATQSPIMARCLKNEKLGRPIFYGAMITEGIVALIWAAVSSYFFFDGGMAEVGAESGKAPVVVTTVSQNWLGVVGGILAILGVVAAPITSGDTAFRSARLIIADFFKMDQKPKLNRLYISLPIFLAAGLLLWYNISDENGFNIIWRYFGLANQALAAFVLWAIVQHLYQRRKGFAYLVALIPAAFMTAVCCAFFVVDKTCLGLDASLAPYVGIAAFALSVGLFYIFGSRKNKYVNRAGGTDTVVRD